MNYIDIFIDSSKPLATPRFKVVEADWLKLCSIFPEPGFRSYFAGFIVSKLVKELEQNGINTYFDRANDPRTANIPRFLSDVQIVRDKTDGNERRTVAGIRDENPQRTGDTCDHADPAQRQSEEGESTESEARSESPRSIVLRHCRFICEAIDKAGAELPFDHKVYNPDETIYGFLNRMTTGELESLYQILISYKS